MKPIVHHLDATQHEIVLSQNRYDPVTGEFIECGNKVVFCAACRSAFLAESWAYLGKKHCGQSRTLAHIPFARHLHFQKDNATFRMLAIYTSASLIERIGALLLDAVLVVLFFPVGFGLMMALAIFFRSHIGAWAVIFPWTWTYLSIIYLLSRDGWIGGASLGKSLCHLKVIQTRTGKKCNLLQGFVRTIVLPLELVAFPYTLYKEESLGDMFTKTRVVREVLD